MILAALVLPLDTDGRPEPAHVQGWFYGLLREIDPEIHQRHDPPPFTLAVGGRQGIYWVRVTLLQEALYAGLSPKLYPLAGRRLRLGDKEVFVRAVVHEGHPWAGLTTYPRLFQGPPVADFPLRFSSPTFFKRKGTHYPLPEPKLVFSSLLARFRAYAPVAPPDALTEVFNRLTLRHHVLRSRPITHAVRGVGFVGQATFHLPQASEEELRWLGALHRFAFYSGVGAKTSLGFGQVRPYAFVPRKGTFHEADQDSK